MNDKQSHVQTLDSYIVTQGSTKIDIMNHQIPKPPYHKTQTLESSSMKVDIVEISHRNPYKKE